MDFNLENKGTWFYFDKEDESKGGVCLRALPSQEAQRIGKKTTTQKIEYKRGQRFEYSVTDDELNLSLILDYCIVEWKEVSANGKELECDTKNKKELLSKSIVFSNFVTEGLEKVNELNEFDLDNQKKTSLDI